MSPLFTAGKFVRSLAESLASGSRWLIQTLLIVFVILLLARFVIDKLNINPFGRIVAWIRRPTNQWFYEVKNSQFYYPARQTFGFDPVWVLLLIAAAIFFYLLSSLINDLVVWLTCLSITLSAFGAGAVGTGVWALIGTVLLGLIYFLMALMTLLVIYSWFGLFERAAHWANQRIMPLLYSFDRSGRLGPFVFLIAFILLGFAASAVQAAFF